MRIKNWAGLGRLFVLVISLLLIPDSASAATAHVVQKGDTLHVLARNHGTTVTQLMQANSLSNHTLLPGRILSTPNQYIVQPGNSLYQIAMMHNLTIAALQQANNSKSSTLLPGQLLWIPDNSSNYYRIQHGDTLYLLANRWQTTTTSILQINGLTSSTLYPGQLLARTANNSQAFTNSQQSVASSGADSSGPATQDLQLLSQLIYSEARGEPYQGKVAVAAVALNRVRNQNFPNTVSGVLYEPGAFSPVTDGSFYLTPDQNAYQAARDAINGWDPSGGALFFWNPATSTNRWIWQRQILKTIGNHVFAI